MIIQSVFIWGAILKDFLGFLRASEGNGPSYFRLSISFLKDLSLSTIFALIST